MIAISEKVDVLKKHGYRYHAKRGLYVNRRMKKVFSLAAIEDHDPDWLSKRVAEKKSPDEWLFYFNRPPSDNVVSEIVAELE